MICGHEFRNMKRLRNVSQCYTIIKSHLKLFYSPPKGLIDEFRDKSIQETRSFLQKKPKKQS